MRKKYSKLFLLSLAILLVIPSSVFAKGDIQILLDGKKIQTDISPYIKNGRTMVPVRFIAEALGGSAEPMKNEGFPKKYREYISVMNQKRIDPIGLDLYINRKVCISGEEAYKMDVAPEIVNNRTMVPLRFLADYLRFNVKWDAKTNSVIITTISNEELNDPEKDNFEKYYYEKGSEALSYCIENGFTEKNLNKVFN